MSENMIAWELGADRVLVLTIDDPNQATNTMTEAFARDLFTAGRRFHLANMLLRPVWRFFRDYIFKMGFLDGIPGIIITASTMYYVFMKHARLWEMERDEGGKKGVR